MTCTAADLINIQPLTLSDTFHTWFDRTNEVIDVVSGVNVFNVDVGQTSGLRVETGCENGYYNGVVTINTKLGGGINIGSESYAGRTNEIVVDYVDLIEHEEAGLSANPAENDYYMFSDVSDTSQGSAGTPRRIRAKHMLPDKVTMGETGNGTLTIEGSVNINGNFFVSGPVSYIDVQDLRIEDKILELAYNRYTSFVVRGTTSDINSLRLKGGFTAYIFDPTNGYNPSFDTPSAIAFLRSVVNPDALLPTSTTADIEIYNFTVGGANDPENGSGVWIGAVSSGVTFDVITEPLTGDGFFNDTVLSPAGIRIMGSESNKEFLWDNTNDNNRWSVNTNFGLKNKEDHVAASRFVAFDFSDGSDRDNKFTFMGTTGANVSLIISNGDVTGAEIDNSYWSLTKASTPGPMKDYQRLILQHYKGAGSSPETISTIHAGSTGTTYPGVGVTSWAQFFNSDMLDGAHATQTPTAYSIPVAYADGKIDPGWVAADSIRKTVTVPNHGFVVGDVVRYDNTGSITFASADTIPTAEAIGIVSVTNGSQVTVTVKGFIDGLPNAGRFAAIYPAVTGAAYFLGKNPPGSMIADPDDGSSLTGGDVRKAMFLATGINKGFVVNYTGVVYGDDETDLLYIPTLAPVGAIHPYAGLTSQIPNSWLLCDGKSYRRIEHHELYGAIEHNHSVISSIYNTGGATNKIQFPDNTRNLIVGDPIRIRWSSTSGLTHADCTVTDVDVSNKRLTFTINSGPALPTINNLSVNVSGRSNVTDALMVFFVPDLRDRTPFGVSTRISLGGIGGLTSTPLPEHAHTHPGGGFGNGVGQNPDSGVLYTGGITAAGGFSDISQISTMPPYVGMHWIIRARKTVGATIMSGHDHDARYIRYDQPHQPPYSSSALSTANKNQFHTNAAVLSDGTLGKDTFHSRLTISNMFAGLTADDWDWWGSGLCNFEDGGLNRSPYFTNSGLRVMGGDATTATINIFNNNAGNYWLANNAAAWSDASSLNFWGVGISGATFPARYVAGLGANIVNESGDHSSVNNTSVLRELSFHIGGKTASAPAFAIRRTENAETGTPWQKSMRFLLPYGLTSAPVHTPNMKHVMLRGGTELVEYTGTALSGSDLHTTGGITFSGAASMSTAVAGSDTAILTVDQGSGTVARKKMLEVTGSDPPAPDSTEASSYPEGFVWYKSGGSQGSEGDITAVLANAFMPMPTNTPGAIGQVVPLMWSYVGTTSPTYQVNISLPPGTWLVKLIGHDNSTIPVGSTNYATDEDVHFSMAKVWIVPSGQYLRFGVKKLATANEYQTSSGVGYWLDGVPDTKTEYGNFTEFKTDAAPGALNKMYSISIGTAWPNINVNTTELSVVYRQGDLGNSSSPNSGLINLHGHAIRLK